MGGNASFLGVRDQEGLTAACGFAIVTKQKHRQSPVFHVKLLFNVDYPYIAKPVDVFLWRIPQPSWQSKVSGDTPNHSYQKENYDCGHTQPMQPIAVAFRTNVGCDRRQEANKCDDSKRARWEKKEKKKAEKNDPRQNVAGRGSNKANDS